MNKQSIKSAQISLRILLTISLVVFLTTGCSILGSNNNKTINTSSTAVERTPLNLDLADPVELEDIEWIIITPENAEEVLNELGDKPVLFGLTSFSYEKLSLNFAEIRKHINTQRNILLRYKKYYEDTPE